MGWDGTHGKKGKKGKKGLVFNMYIFLNFPPSKPVTLNMGNEKSSGMQWDLLSPEIQVLTEFLLPSKFRG